MTNNNPGSRRSRVHFSAVEDSVSGCFGDGVERAPASRLKINADLQDVAHQIHEEFADRLDRQEVDECLMRVAAQFDGAKVRAFVPLLGQPR